MAGNGMQDVSAVFVRQNTRIAFDATIDGFLSEADVTKLYARYIEASEKYGWPEIYRLQADEKMITCEQILAIPMEQLVKVYGKAMAGRLAKAAKDNTQLR